MCVKNSMHHGTLEQKEMKEITKTSNLIVDHFSLMFVNLPLAVMYEGDSGEKSPRRFFRWFWDFLKEEKFFQFFYSKVLC